MKLGDRPGVLERRCADCVGTLPLGALFCPQCGASQSPGCATCGRAGAPDALFCAGCGKPLHQAANAAAAAMRPAWEPSRADHAERRQITFLFCDLVDSTAMADGRDPEDFREIVRAYHEAAVQVVQDFDGHVAQYLGDGLLVYFGYPRAHEDAAARALHAGVGILAALPALNRQLGLVDGERLRVRIGVHTGVVVVGDVGAGGRLEQLAIGDAPNIAARLQSLAPPDGIVASGATQRVVRRAMDWRDLGALKLKGVSQPLHAFAVGTDPVRATGGRDHAAEAAPIVGRDFEAGLLESAWESAQAGAGTVVLVSGEPGIGKSRLLAAARDMAARDAGRTILFRCSPYHAASDLHPVIEWMEHSLLLSSDDTTESRLARLRQALAETSGAHPDALGLLAGLLSIPLPEGSQPQRLTPQIVKQRTQSALAAWLLSQARHEPLLLAFEDLHWADPSTLSLIEELTGQLGSMRVALLVTFRPEFAPRGRRRRARCGWCWSA